jgi:hypothetical protein
VVSIHGCGPCDPSSILGYHPLIFKMEEKSTWQEIKELTKISLVILMFIWKYKNWKERKILEENNINYQKEF